MKNLKLVDWRFIAHKYLKLHGPRTYSRLIWRFFLPTQTWEPHVWKAIKHLEGDLFVDVGANRGLYSIGLRKKFREVIAIEPRPDTADFLRKVLPRNSNIKVSEVALCEFDGDTTLFIQGAPYGTMGVLQPSSGSADTLERDFRYRPASMPKIDKSWDEEFTLSPPAVTVKTRRLDSLVHQQIDLLKIDVEGAEFRVLQGSEKLLSAGMIKHIIVELHDRKRKAELERMFTVTYKTRWVDPDHLYAEKR